MTTVECPAREGSVRTLRARPPGAAAGPPARPYHGPMDRRTLSPRTPTEEYR